MTDTTYPPPHSRGQIIVANQEWSDALAELNELNREIVDLRDGMRVNAVRTAAVYDRLVAAGYALSEEEERNYALMRRITRGGV